MVDEAARLAALRELGVLDTAPETELDEVVELAARVFDAPTALVSLVDADRQWFKARIGLNLEQTPRTVAFCNHTIRQTGALVVEDTTADPRFRDYPLVVAEPHIRFYAGAPLTTASGAVIGSLCVMDTRARTANAYQQAMLLTLADQVVRQLEARAGVHPGPAGAGHGQPLSSAPRPGHLRRLVAEGATGYVEMTPDGVLLVVNTAFADMLGVTPPELLGRRLRDLVHPVHPSPVNDAEDLLRSGARSTYEATRVYRHRTGRAVTVHCTWSHQAATPEGPESLAALVVDLSSRLNADTDRVTAELGHRRVLEAAADAYIHIDALGVVLEWNAAAEHTFGYTAEQAIGATLAALIVPEDQREAHVRGIARLLDGAASTMLGKAVEVTARHRDGSPIPVELTPWRAAAGAGGGGFHAFCRDISDRVTARAALEEANRLLRQEQERLQSAFHASLTADAVVDDEGTVLDANVALVRFLGRPREQLLGRPITSVVYEPDLAAAARMVARPDGGRSDRVELRFVTGDGHVRWGQVSLVETDDDTHRAVLRIENVQAFKELEDALARQSTHDPVTGLPNRALFLDHVRQAVVLAGTGVPAAVLILRVEGLRALIDEEGFGAEDSALGLLAQRLTAASPPGVTVASLQPGVFALVVAGGGRDAAGLANLLLATTSTPLQVHDSVVTVRASIGISTTGSPGADGVAVNVVLETGRLVQDAENAARRGRDEGGNVVVFAAPEMRRAQRRQHELEAHIRRALAAHQVGMAFQPVFDLSSGVIVSAEALLRLTDPDGRPLPPLDVVSAAEASGQIVELGARVLQLGAAQAARWRDDHGVLVPVAVNVSAVQLTRGTFTADVVAALELAGVPPHALTLELTESVLLESGSAGMEQLLVLRDHGVHLAIDDFGTGYASLVYLRDLPATTLKIDRSFIEGIPDDRGAMTIVAGVIGLARSFGMVCIAEGIETDTQRAYLSDHGVLGQGFLLARPTDGATVSRLIARHGARTASDPRDTLSVAKPRDAADDLPAARRDDTASRHAV